MTSLRALKPPKPPFEPPTPETSPTTTPVQTAGAVAAGFGLVALDIATAGFVSALASIPTVSADEPGPPDITPLLAQAAGTSPPVDDGEGNVQCSRCTYLVPYATMSLNEDGYFCAACAKELTERATISPADVE